MNEQLQLIHEQLAKIEQKIENLKGYPKRYTVAELGRMEGVSYGKAKRKYKDKIVPGSSPMVVEF